MKVALLALVVVVACDAPPRANEESAQTIETTRTTEEASQPSADTSGPTASASAALVPAVASATAPSESASRVESAAPSSHAQKTRCEWPEAKPPPSPGLSGAAALSFDWVADDGGCTVPKGFQPWSWSMLRRVSGLRDKAVVLTVDGAQNIDVANAGLDVLKRYGVHATYFLTTSALEHDARGAELVRRIAGEGHEIANHSHQHPHMTKLDDAHVREEVEKADAWLADILGFSPRPFFRPPFLDHDARTGRILEDLCYRPVWFTVYARDDEAGISADDITEAVLCDERGAPRKLRRGSILMFHASQKETVKAWPVIFTALRERGFSILPLGEALRSRRSSPE